MKSYFCYKPYGMLSQFSRELPHHRTLADLAYNFPKDVYPVGRLDADSEGLLLLTNDTSLNKQLLNPQSKSPKTYTVLVEGVPTDEKLKPLSTHGVDIKHKGKVYRTQPCKITLLAAPPQLPDRDPPVRVRKTIIDSWLTITLTEGKNRQVRKMLAAVGYPVLRLVRTQFWKYEYGEGQLKEMGVGDVIEV